MGDRPKLGLYWLDKNLGIWGQIFSTPTVDQLLCADFLKKITTAPDPSTQAGARHKLVSSIITAVTQYEGLQECKINQITETNKVLEKEKEEANGKIQVLEEKLKILETQLQEKEGWVQFMTEVVTDYCGIMRSIGEDFNSKESSLMK